MTTVAHAPKKGYRTIHLPLAESAYDRLLSHRAARWASTPPTRMHNTNGSTETFRRITSRVDKKPRRRMRWPYGRSWRKRR